MKLKCFVENCNKKISLLRNQLKCKCDKIFCKNHYFYTEHNCKFDFYNEHQIKIEKENKKIFKEKVSKI